MVVHVTTGLKRWDMILMTRILTTFVINATPRGRIIFLTRPKNTDGVAVPRQWRVFVDYARRRLEVPQFLRQENRRAPENKG